MLPVVSIHRRSAVSRIVAGSSHFVSAGPCPARDGSIDEPSSLQRFVQLAADVLIMTL